MKSSLTIKAPDFGLRCHCSRSFSKRCTSAALVMVMVVIPMLLSACSFQEIRGMKPSMASSTGGQLFARSELGVISYANHLGGLNQAQINQELALARKNYQRDKDSYNTLRLAAALMHTPTAIANLRQAENILQSFVKNSNNKTGWSALTSRYDNYQTVAQFLLNHLAQRKTMVAENLSLKQKIEQLMLIENKLSQPQATTFR